MNLELEVEYLLCLVSNTQDKINRDINKNRNANRDINQSEDELPPIIRFNVLVDDFRHKLRDFELKILPRIENLIPDVEYKTLLNAYFGLVKDVFHVLLRGGDSLSKELTGSIFSLFFEIEKLSEAIVNNQLISKKFSSKLMYDVISYRVLFDSELRLSIIDEVKVSYIKRIDIEIDSVHKLFNSKLKEVSKQYSDSRADIVAAYNSYETKVSDMLLKADERINKYDFDFKDKEAQINKKEIYLDGKLLNAEKKLEVIEGVLQRTNEAGMASAFKARHVALKWPMYFWGGLFFVCLGILVWFGKEFVYSAFSSEIKSVAELISRLVATFPLIWGAWFSAKQYGHISQLREDYAYKVAVAMTYHGYKDEAKTVDDMSGKLIESIITQLSDNPVRLYQNNSSASMMESLIKNDKLSDMMNAAIKPK